MVKVFSANIEKETMNNSNYRKILHTTDKMQLVIMNIPPQENISLEIHPEHDQFIKVEDGDCIVLVYDGNKKIIDRIHLSNGWSIIIPANTWHEVRNMSYIKSVRLYTIYTPPKHKVDIVNIDKNGIDVVNPDKRRPKVSNKYKLVSVRK
jgi:mannose-6-phosphate isomerase-like protein (cupin superfamily)